LYSAHQYVSCCIQLKNVSCCIQLTNMSPIAFFSQTYLLLYSAHQYVSCFIQLTNMYPVAFSSQTCLLLYSARQYVSCCNQLPLYSTVTPKLGTEPKKFQSNNPDAYYNCNFIFNSVYQVP